MFWGKHGVTAPRLALWAGVLATVGLLAWNGLSSLYMMWAFATPLPIGDQWDSAYFPDDFAQRLFALHNEHRPALGRLVGLADWYLANGRNGVNIAFIALCFPVFAVALYRLIRQSGVGTRGALLATALAMAIQTSAEQWENLSWGFQTAFVGSFAFAALAMSSAASAASAARAHASATRMAVLYAVCLVSSLLSVFSLASGLFTLVGVAVLLFTADAPKPLKWSYPVLAIAVIAFYLNHYSTPGDHTDPLRAISHPLALIHYALVYLGGPFAPGGDTAKAGLVGGFAAILIGGLTLDAGRLTLKNPSLWRTTRGAAYAALLILAFTIVGTALMAALGRVLFGPLQAMSSRYGTPALAFWADVVVLCLVRAQLGAGPAPMVLRRGAAALGVFLAFCLAFHQLGYVNLVGRMHAERMSGAMAYLLGVRGAPALSVYPVADRVAAGALDQRFESLAREHKSIFTESWPGRLGTPLRAWVGEPQGQCRGVVDNRTSLVGERSPTQRLEGWAWLTDRRRAPDLIVFADDQGQIVGFGAPGFTRKALRKALHSRRAVLSGFVGYAWGAGQTKLRVYALTLSGGSARACVFAVTGG